MYVVEIGNWRLPFKFKDREDALTFFDLAVEHGDNLPVSMRWEAEDEKCN